MNERLIPLTRDQWMDLRRDEAVEAGYAVVFYTSDVHGVTVAQFWNGDTLCYSRQWEVDNGKVYR